MWELLDRILNNSSVASVLAVLVASFLGIKTFWKQRRISKIENLSENIELLVNKCEDVNLILDRISNTYKEVKTEDQKKIFFDALKSEVSKMSYIINDDVPRLRAKIKNYINFNFLEENIIKEEASFFEELKKWHDNIIKLKLSEYDFNKRTEESEKFSLEPLKASADSLRKKI